MSDTDLELGIVGLGKIGGNLAQQATEKGVRVVGFDTADRPELEERGVEVHDAGAYDTLVDELDPPRVIYLSLPAGPLVDDELDDLLEHLEEGDVVMDGGNSFWRDSIRREERASEEGVYFLDTGTSGGPPRAKEGVCFMVGGKQEGFDIAEPYLDLLSVDGGLLHVGPPGSGHFVKLVHNGIEFGMLQSIAEGVELMEKGLRKEDQQSDAPDFADIPNYIEDTGEVNWLVSEAYKGETPIPVISQSVTELFKSRGNQRHAYRAIALMRHGFGEHPFGADEGIEDERLHGRVDNEARHDLRDDEDVDPVGPLADEEE